MQRHHHPASSILGRTLAELMDDLSASPQGLTTLAAQQRQQPEGGRTLASALLVRAATLLRGVLSPLSAILLVAAAASASLGDFTDALIITAMVALSSSLNLWQSYRSSAATRKLGEQVTPTARVLRDGQWATIPRQALVRGDILQLAAGDLVPADARLVTSKDLFIHEAALTGESLPVEKFATAEALMSSEPDGAELVFLGTSVVSGSGTAVAYAVGHETAFGDIVALLAARPEETEFERGTRQFSIFILKIVLFLVLFILVIHIALGRSPMQSLLFSVALAVGLTPEFLPMIVSVTLAQGAMQMAKKKVIVRHLPAIQNLGSIDILCSDKTGTLTRGEMSLTEALDPVGEPSEQVLILGIVNSKFQTGIRSPLDAAILAQDIHRAEAYTKTDEIPFDFERRRLSVVVHGALGYTLITKGAPESILEISSTFSSKSGQAPLTPSDRNQCHAIFTSLCVKGLRVLGVAFKEVSSPTGHEIKDEQALCFAGFLAFSDPLSPDVAATVADLRHDGVTIKILTGDNEHVTRQICSQAGINAEHVVLGKDLDALDDLALLHLVEKVDVFARVSPAQKHKIVRSLKMGGHVVGYLGDGINDAPSLHLADVGISVSGASDIAREASDIILLESRLDVLHEGIIAGRTSFGNVIKYLLMGTSSNFGNMFSMAGAALFLPFLPMLSKQILLNNFLYDLAQITIPSDKVDPAYTAAPQRWDIRIIRNFMMTLGPVSSCFDFMTFYILLHVFRFNESLFQTGWFLESLATQTLVLFVIRTAGRPWKNRPSAALTVTTLAVVMVSGILPYTAVGARFGLTPLPLQFFPFLILVTGLYLVIVEVVKARLMRQIFARPSKS